MNPQEAFARIDANTDFILGFVEYQRGIQKAIQRLTDVGYNQEKIDRFLRECETKAKYLASH